MAKKHVKKDIIKIFSQYGIHIWAILIIANAALAYAFHFSTQASTDTSTMAVAVSPTLEDATTPTINPKKDKPLGSTLTLAFGIPGVGSGSANMTPVHFQRNVSLFLYASDANSLNKSVKPLYTFQTKANFDTNTTSPTYTSYVIKNFDFGPDVKKGKYQIAFRTDQSLRTLIKESPDNVGGELFDFRENSKLNKIPVQTVLMGDTLPQEGDNTVDISDYNAFINCFGEKVTSDSCQGLSYGDFDDNGTIDGVDYNLLVRAFNVLLKQGQSIPEVTAVPTLPQRVTTIADATATPAKKPTPTKAPAASVKGSGGNVLGGILFFLFLLIGGAIVFVLFKKNEKFRKTVLGLLHKSPTGTPPAQPSEPDGQAATPATSDQAADPNAVAAATELPIPPPAVTPDAPEPDAAAIAESTEIPLPATPAPTEQTTDGVTEKDCYVKKVGPDEAGTGTWIRLTDDNGALEGHYSKLDVTDGFAKVKGVMKSENGKNFLEVSEIIAEG